MMLVAAPAAAQPTLVPPPKPTGEVRPPPRRPWEPIPWFYRQIEIDRQNVGANGRKNAIRDEQLQAESPARQPAPLSDW